ncbi:MAG: V/A-type H+/Na+-transporting ATPase subunit [Thermoplasmata archaeon]|jgi:V/A-type H+-transporting ATPase subunit K|nr:V/A-type H+/Na+-transporting ATPase subunit [Thermoplasmata archaeon]
MQNKLVVLGLTLVCLGLIPAASAGDCTTADSCKESAKGWIAIGAGIAVGLAGLGTGIAQSQIGAAAVGATAEDAGFLGRALLFIAIPETVVIFGLLIAFLLLGKI